MTKLSNKWACDHVTNNDQLWMIVMWVINDCHVTDNNCHVAQLMTMCHTHLASESHLQWTCCRSRTWQKFVWVAWSLGLASFFGHQIMPYEGKDGKIEEGREGGRKEGGKKFVLFLRVAASLTKVFCALFLALFPGTRVLCTIVDNSTLH